MLNKNKNILMLKSEDFIDLASEAILEGDEVKLRALMKLRYDVFFQGAVTLREKDGSYVTLSFKRRQLVTEPMSDLHLGANNQMTHFPEAPTLASINTETSLKTKKEALSIMERTRTSQLLDGFQLEKWSHPLFVPKPWPENPSDLHVWDQQTVTDPNELMTVSSGTSFWWIQAFLKGQHPGVALHNGGAGIWVHPSLGIWESQALDREYYYGKIGAYPRFDYPARITFEIPRSKIKGVTNSYEASVLYSDIGHMQNVRIENLITGVSLVGETASELRIDTSKRAEKLEDDRAREYKKLYDIIHAMEYYDHLPSEIKEKYQDEYKNSEEYQVIRSDVDSRALIPIRFRISCFFIQKNRLMKKNKKKCLASERSEGTSPLVSVKVSKHVASEILNF